MLILIPGATGNLGLHLVHSALARGHQVRAIGRSPSKMPAEVRNKLESFVEICDTDDTISLDAGCKGADAVIVAYNGGLKLALDGQLPLLRAAERAGIKRFHAMSWNLDWEHMPLGTIETYDGAIMFSRQAKLTSSIKPLYTFCGVLAMTMFGSPGAGALEGENAIWRRTEGGGRTFNVVGAGDNMLSYSVEADVADFTVALVTSDDAEKGGFYRFCSDEFTGKDLARIYEEVRGAKCAINQVMDVDICRALIDRSRREVEEAGELAARWRDIIGLVYGLYMAEPTYIPRPVDVKRFSGVPRTSLENYIRANAWI